MVDEAPPNSQQHAHANIHVRHVRRTDVLKHSNRLDIHS